MKIEKIWAACFSPTGGTKTIVQLLAGELADRLQIPMCTIDFTDPGARQEEYCFGETDLFILGMPVYAGRIPNKILPDVDRMFSGKDTPTIPVSVFGNRSYDDALMEEKLLLERHGFQVIAAAAAVSRHVFSAKIAAGRPDQQDQKELRIFAGQVAEKIRLGEKGVLQETEKNVYVKGNNPVGAYYTPLGIDGQPARFLKAKPIVDKEKCTQCGLCAKVCPMGSILPEDGARTEGICIKCQACIQKCPVQARKMLDEAFLSHVKMLEEHYTKRASNAFFW